MKKPLRILYLEDDPDFAELVHSLFQQDNLRAEVKRVVSRAEFETALASETFDVILSDFRLPEYTGLEALAFVRREYPDIPFILVSGTIGEHAAIESLKAGATDYVLKQNPERLASAVRRAVQEAEERVKRRQMEMELIRREKYFRTLTENSLNVLCILSQEGNFLYTSPSMEHVLGYTPEELSAIKVPGFDSAMSRYDKVKLTFAPSLHPNDPNGDKKIKSVTEELRVQLALEDPPGKSRAHPCGGGRRYFHLRAAQIGDRAGGLRIAEPQQTTATAATPLPPQFEQSLAAIARRV